jgi:hypothetical protein
MAEFKTQTYRNAAGQERVVSSVDGAVAAEFDGFYAPDSPSGKRLASQKAAATRKASADKPAAKRTTRKATAKTPTRDAVDSAAEAARAAEGAAPTA